MEKLIACEDSEFIDGPPEVVFDVLRDHSCFRDSTAVEQVVLERDGFPDATGLGSVWAVRLKVGWAVQHEVNHYWPPSVFGYRQLGQGQHALDHQGIVVLTPRDGGTQIAWYVTCKPNPATPGALEALQELIPASIRGLIVKASLEVERRAGAEAS